ncbi:MAG: dephospho-CoA kinase [Abditibacteriota bacterium]|nr:dephospho-CoA kinase [Abditibacteriota bacterium]
MILGVTGTIGAGKTTVCSVFKEMGYPVISADEIGHEILTYNSVKESLRETFGDVFDRKGSVDRKKLAGKVFSSKENLEKLNCITHPLIKDEIIKRATKLESKHSLVVCEVPLLFECGWEGLFDKILVVYVSKEETLNRLEKRGMTKEDAVLRYNSQMNPVEKIKKADFSISNEGNLEELAFQVAQILNNC